MLNAIAQNAVVSAANPALDLWVQDMVTDPPNSADGVVTWVLADPTAASFQVWNTVNPDAPQQVFPGSGSHAVNLTSDKIGGQAGHFAAAWTVGTETLGRHEIRWTYTLATGATKTMRREFDVVVNVPTGYQGGYCLIGDMRDEGLLSADAGDARLLRVIAQASRFIERCTGRFFEPRLQTQQLDGNGGRAIQMGDPLIALVQVTLGNPPVNSIGYQSLRVYNRHLTEGLINPDDRNDPKIEFMHYKDLYGRQGTASVDSPLFGVPFRDMYFPNGVQNVNVTGLFGYTDPDGSSVGMTPDLIRHATKLIVMREAYQLTDDRREDARKRHRLTAERVRDQSYNLDALTEGAFTGDREIDDLLLAFVRPMHIGAA